MNSINDLKQLNKTNTSLKNEMTHHEPTFAKEGTLAFIAQANNDTLGVINIEIADDDAQRQQGLMYRSTMNENEGMLFIFDESELQSFWMKNTILSLDIIYVDENNSIVTIHRNTQPYSEAQIPSYKKAKYVVEVNAGYCTKYNIKEGDMIYASAIKTGKVSV